MKYILSILLLMSGLGLYGWINQSVTADHLSTQLRISERQISLYKALIELQANRMTQQQLKDLLFQLKISFSTNIKSFNEEIFFEDIIITLDGNKVLSIHKI